MKTRELIDELEKRMEEIKKLKRFTYNGDVELFVAIIKTLKEYDKLKEDNEDREWALFKV